MNSAQNIDLSAFKSLQESPRKFYKEYSQAKKKFGNSQIDSNGQPKMRDISRPVYSLKLAQRRINNQLKEFELPDSMYGGVGGSNNVVNAFQHRANKYFLTIDLKKFFNTISNSMVHQTLISKGLTWSEARAITNLTTYKESLPQGAPTSTTLANLVFAPVALLLEQFCKERNITFTVFVDDLTFSSTRCFKKYATEVLNIIKLNKFAVNHNKIHYKKGYCEVTGIIIRKGELSLPKEILNNRNKPGIEKYISAVLKQYDMLKGLT